MLQLKFNPEDPWDWYIYLHEWLNSYGFHVGRCTSPMDPLGKIDIQFFRSKDSTIGDSQGCRVNSGVPAIFGRADSQNLRVQHLKQLTILRSSSIISSFSS